jgi:periplasmic copper chaperone A
MRKIATIVLATVASGVVAAPAFAHVTANPSTGPQEGRVTTFLRVGHGCEGENGDTERVSVRIPEGVIGVGPEDEPGWTVSTKTRELDEPIEGEGEEITEVVSEVTWTAQDGPLDTHQFREFGLNLNIAAPGEEVLWFPVVQQCEEGSLRWSTSPTASSSGERSKTPRPTSS